MSLLNFSKLVPILQVEVPGSFKDTFNFLQGNGVYEEGMMHFLKGMKETIWTHYDVFLADAQALCAILMLIYFAIICYGMISGDKKLEVMPLLRPFGLVMVILWWPAFTKVIAYPGALVENRTEQLFDGSQSHINDLRMQRAKLMVDVSDALFKLQASTEIAKSEADTWYENAWESVKSSVKEGFSQVWNPVVEMRNRLQVGLQLLASSLLETMAIWILRISVYVIFIVQIIFSTILIILGPFSVAASILPAFRQSFTEWIARFVSVSLYSGIAYLVMYVASLFQQYALEAEILRYSELLSGEGESIEKLSWFAANGVLSFGMVIITFIIGAITMFTVPSISTWIVSTSGVSSAASAMGSGATRISSMATSAVGGM
ncbi:plasmid transfer protein [Pedobacter sp. MC2016-05]|uniref:plasmid transfer protein n=1 Tax=Pedobacter sp. MC2016-05 TaxID=2994474 RepID=UPI0022471D17|nr:plasmid transfer protein [Pedobacter sp. MC2016-05]MCX2476322.1 plasmid transfer protein [Pedobacter sp. MC2016-05]